MKLNLKYETSQLKKALLFIFHWNTHLFRFLVEKVFKVPEGERLPKALIGTDIDLNTLDESKMNRAGWYRKERVSDSLFRLPEEKSTANFDISLPRQSTE